MDALKYMIELTQSEESALNKFLNERRRKRLLDRVNQLGFYIREMQKEQLKILKELDRKSLAG